ncbi:MAG: hypothetical protein M1816_002227 [Peltula sp. TS41687]|nr:MAG: hypothetical protein M1816_002227 [Peltula sp. TS41687]
MDASTDFYIDDLAARTTFKDYGDIRIVAIPGFSTLSESERAAVWNRRQQREMATPLDANALTSRLREITPPLDEEEENKESRVFEAQAREELESENCPPCYPAYLDVPLQNPPEKYQAIISYWKSFQGIYEVVLRAQLSDWRKFRYFQRRIRAYYRNQSFSSFVDKVRERRKRHGVGGVVRLLLDPKQQSPLENWMEFQNYHLQRLENFEKERDKLRKELDEKELDDAWKKVEVTERAAWDAETVRRLLKTTERDVERHKVLLQWIEQERQTMDTGHSTPTEENHDGRDTAPKAVRRAPTPDRRTRRAQPSMVLGKVRITKAQSTQKPKALGLGPAIQNSDVRPRSSIPQASKRREIKSRRTKEGTPLGQLRQQRAPSKCRPASQPSQPARENVITRRGRISKPPVRWAPY